MLTKHIHIFVYKRNNLCGFSNKCKNFVYLLLFSIEPKRNVILTIWAVYWIKFKTKYQNKVSKQSIVYTSYFCCVCVLLWQESRTQTLHWDVKGKQRTITIASYTVMNILRFFFERHSTFDFWLWTVCYNWYSEWNEVQSIQKR